MLPSWLQLANRHAIVTGAGSGIGAMVTKALREQGCYVTATDVREMSSPKVVKCDVSNEEEVYQLFKNYEGSSILINCAGITRDGWVKDMHTKNDWNPVIDVNLTGTFLCCREFLNQNFTETAAIVNVSSVVGTQGNLGQTNYAASKGGVLSFSRSLAKEVANRRVRVNCVVPGFIRTPMVSSVPEKIQNMVKQRVALGEFGEAEDVANLILFLASCKRSGYITGEAVECSGLISL
mmetsp:Transcript_12336/g.18950  ORF Transcript_12336/g.18950 Transcript_12336/m.18950 type:complete len:236 (-) Transcript_12336:1618-2325(-)